MRRSTSTEHWGTDLATPAETTTLSGAVMDADAAAEVWLRWALHLCAVAVQGLVPKYCCLIEHCPGKHPADLGFPDYLQPAQTPYLGLYLPGIQKDRCQAHAEKLDHFHGCGWQVRRRENLTWRLRVDSSSLMPPERKWMPGTAGGMLRSIVRTVYLATSCGGGVGTSRPGRHMLGFSSMPSIRMPYSFSSRNTWL